MKNNKVSKILQNRINLENFICLIIIICPILDMASFVFRNIYNTRVSPSTIIRPILPVIIFLYIFLNNKFKFKIVCMSFVYGVYAIIHLLIFNTLKSNSSYGGLIDETQYLINYTFMILNLFIFSFIFKQSFEKNKLNNSTLEEKNNKSKDLCR